MHKTPIQELSFTDLIAVKAAVSNIVSNTEAWLEHIRQSSHSFTQMPPAEAEVKKALNTLKVFGERRDLLNAEFNSRIEALFPAPVEPVKPDHKAEMWYTLLGFIPERVYSTDEHSNCLNCNSKNFLRFNSPAWTGKYMCNDCKYFMYIIYQDKMGTVAADYVAIDKRDASMIPSKSSTET